MARIPTLRTGLLDIAMSLGLAGPVLMVLYSYDIRPLWLTATVTVLTAVAIAVWVLWRRSRQRSRVAAALFAVIAVVVMSFGNGALYYGIIWAALLMLGVTFSATRALWGYATTLVVIVLSLHLASGSPAEFMLAEAIGTAVLAGIAAAVAVVLRDSLRVNDDLQDALARLDAAHAELQRRYAADRDLVLAQERERTARELHDDLGHRLTAVGLSLDYASRVADPAAARDEVVHARAVVGESLEAMRRLVRAMHPIDLGELGDLDAFRTLAESFRGTGLTVMVEIEGERSLAREHALLLLRFVQEGLTNVIRHADAATASLRIEVGPSSIQATLDDDGSASQGGTPPAGGFGLRSLRARAEELGGSLAVEGGASGFRLSMLLPIEASGETAGASEAVIVPAGVA
ncbi:sensor histidine kinase [Microbacterium sp. NPDC006705]|uniref:sensor histidine kinase n=1 Tax=Microbacterium sp. NPDC006705 TaxID=3364181 RepID=UPI00384BBD49